MSAVITQLREDGVLSVAINRPEQRNSLSNEVLELLHRSFASLGDDVGVVVLEGVGGKAFSAGGDLTQMGSDAAAELAAHDGRGKLAELFMAMWGCGVPTIAKVDGFALAGGCGLALACDFVIASENSVFGVPEINVGLWPYMITVPLLRSMPVKTALDLMLTGRRVPASEAHALGFVRSVVPVENLQVEVDELASMLAAKPRSTVRLGRTSFYRSVDAGAAEAFAMLHPMLSVTLRTPAAAEGLRAFAEKRAPRWQ
jgi:enoyl-CoA hydratase/carnithine racemase